MYLFSYLLLLVPIAIGLAEAVPQNSQTDHTEPIDDGYRRDLQRGTLAALGLGSVATLMGGTALVLQLRRGSRSGEWEACYICESRNDPDHFLSAGDAANQGAQPVSLDRQVKAALNNNEGKYVKWVSCMLFGVRILMLYNTLRITIASLTLDFYQIRQTWDANELHAVYALVEYLGGHHEPEQTILFDQLRVRCQINLHAFTQETLTQSLGNGDPSSEAIAEGLVTDPEEPARKDNTNLFSAGGKQIVEKVNHYFMAPRTGRTQMLRRPVGH